MKTLKLRLDPLTRRRLDRFKSIKRAYWSFKVMLVLVLLTLIAELLVNSRALIVSYEGKLHFPTYDAIHTGKNFGLSYDYEPNYRELSIALKENGKGWVLMPPFPYNPYEQDFREGSYPPFPPSFKDRHYLGTDSIGRDIVARLFYGFRIAIFFSMAFVFITFFMGTLLGCLMGYWGGVFDILFQRIIEILDQIPFLYIVMIITAIYKPDILMFLAVFCFFGWTARTWSVRAMTYRERERDYILAARAMGASTWRIMTVHIIPNILVVIVTMLPFAVSGGISSLTALDYLGFGLRPPTPSWGELILQGLSAMKESPWILSSVVVALTSILVMIAFVGEGLRDAFDPKKYTVYK